MLGLNFFNMWGFTVLPRLDLNSWAQAVLSPQPPEELGLQVHTTMPGSEMICFYQQWSEDDHGHC